MLRIVEGFPRSFSRYALLTAFGRGGMGDVYLAKQRIGEGERLVVVKTLRGDLSADQEYVRRFLDEARVVSQLNHAHISTVYEAGIVGHDHFLTMEFIHGVNLKEFAAALTSHRSSPGGDELPLEPGLAIVIGDAILGALAHAHRLRSPTTQEPLRIVHRDVSPANVMIGFEGEVKLIDFGLADSSMKTEHTETRVVMGKVAYMSPEQARGDDVDGRCDQFAAAVTLYELLTGDRFYGDMNSHQIWQVVGVGGFVPRSWQRVPSPLRLPLATALDKNPARRFADCDAFRAALDEIRAEHFPRSSPQKLRDVVQGLYATRMEEERQLIASFAHLQPPTHDVATDFSGLPSLSPPSSTEPHFTSPSAPAPGPGPAWLAGATVSSRLDQTMPSPPPTMSSSSPVASPPPMVSTSSPVAATPPSSSPPPWSSSSPPPAPGEATMAAAIANPAGRHLAAALAALAVVAVVAVVVAGRTPEEPSRPAPRDTPGSTTKAPPPTVAAPPQPPVQVDPPPAPPVEPAVPSPPSLTFRPRPAPSPAPTTVVPPPPSPAPPAPPAPPPPAPSGPIEMTDAEKEQAVRTCVVAVPPLVRTNALDPTKPFEARKTLLDHWGPRCVRR